MEWCFYKESGVLHDVQKEIVGDSINPATNKPYASVVGDWTEPFYFVYTKDLFDLKYRRDLKYLYKEHREVLMKAISKWIEDMD